MRGDQRKACADMEEMRAQRLDLRDVQSQAESRTCAKPTAVMASQRHSRMRASAKAAAVTTAR